MKKLIQLFTILCITGFTGFQAAAQCDPDTTCKDTGNPGEFCPKYLPQAVLGEPYEAVITVIPPSQYDYQGNILDIVYIELDSVLNLPPGIEYTPNADMFYADTAYCIMISGTPAETGDYNLAIYITPTINHPLTGTIKASQIVDDTSVVMTVQGPSGLDPARVNEFHVFHNVPNPFSDMTRIGFYTPVDDQVELRVFNILGELVHRETMLATPGEHYFRVYGSSLVPGPYFYHIKSSSSRYIGKCIKLQ